MMQQTLKEPKHGVDLSRLNKLPTRVLYEVYVRIIEGDLPKNEKLHAIWTFLKAVFYELNIPRPAVTFTNDKSLKDSYCSRLNILSLSENTDFETLIIGIAVHLNHQVTCLLKKREFFIRLAKKYGIQIDTIVKAYNGDQASKAKIFLFMQALKVRLADMESAFLWETVEENRHKFLDFICAYCKKDEKNAVFIQKCVEEVLSWRNPFQAVTLREWLK